MVEPKLEVKIDSEAIERQLTFVAQAAENLNNQILKIETSLSGLKNELKYFYEHIPFVIDENGVKMGRSLSSDGRPSPLPLSGPGQK